MGTPREPRVSDVQPDEDDSPSQEVSLQRIQILNLVLTVVLALAALAFSLPLAAGVAIGGGLMAANFRIIVVVIRSVFLKGTVRFGNVGLYWAKFIGVMALTGVLLLKFEVDPVGFLVGMSMILLSITVEAVLTLSGH